MIGKFVFLDYNFLNLSDLDSGMYRQINGGRRHTTPIPAVFPGMIEVDTVVNIHTSAGY